MEMVLVRSVDGAGYEAKLSELIGGLHAERSILTEPSLSSWCSSDKLSDEWSASTHEYLVNDIDFEVRPLRDSARKVFVDWHNVNVLGIPPQ